MKIKHFMRKKCQQRLALLLSGALLWGMPTSWAADLSLQAAINMALSQNTGLKITQKGEDTAKAALDEAKGSNGVSVSASDSLSSSKSGNSERQKSNSLGINASVPLYSGGKNQADIRKAELGVQSADWTTERGQENLKLNVIQAYYDALEARKTVSVRQETVDKYQEHYTNVSQLFSAGSKARIDVIRSSVELSNARQNLIKAQNSYEVDLATLRNYLNMNRTEPLNLTTDFTYDAFNIDMDACIDYAYRNRKDLLADQYKLEQQEQAIKSAKAGYLPSLNFKIGLNQTNTFDPSNSSHGDSATLGLSWDLFDSGVTKAAVRTAETSRDVAKLNLLQAKEDIDLAVRQAYYNMREAEKRFNSTKDAVNQAEEDYYIAHEKYRAGEGLMLDIIDAQEALSTARLNYISAQYDYARYKAAVENAMGIGLTGDEMRASDQLVTNVDQAVADSSVARQAGDTKDAVQAAQAKVAPIVVKNNNAKGKRAKSVAGTAGQLKAAGTDTTTAGEVAAELSGGKSK